MLVVVFVLEEFGECLGNVGGFQVTRLFCNVLVDKIALEDGI